VSDPIKQLRRELVAAAHREALRHGHARRWRRWTRRVRSRTAALGVAAVVIGSATAVAASGLLGNPVASGPRLLGGAQPGSVVLSALRVRDPAGGLPWGIRTYRPRNQPSSRARYGPGATCAQIGHVLDDKLGVIGEDGAFGDDGRFHPLPLQPASDDCAGAQGFVTYGRIPASGYSGPGSCAVPAATGGARGGDAAAALSGRSPALRGHPQRPQTCTLSALRLVAFGIAPRGAVGVRGLVPGLAESEYFKAPHDRAFLFVLPTRTATLHISHPVRVVVIYHR